jgi:hypothetical protein
VVALLLVSLFVGSRVFSQVDNYYGCVRSGSCYIQGILLWDMATDRVFAGLAGRRRMSHVVERSIGGLRVLVGMILSHCSAIDNIEVE